MIYAGVSHLTWARSEFQAQVPEFMPLSKDLIVLLSGVVEILLGFALVFLKKRKRQVGIIMAIFFVAVFPGNLHQYFHHVDAFGLDSDRARLIRLFFQPVLILWALWSCGVTRDGKTVA